MSAKWPLDRFPYLQHHDSRPFSPDLASGSYVFVQAEDGRVWVLPETEGHLHPRVLGGANPALAAGGLQMGIDGVVLEIDNFSGTFQFEPSVLRGVIRALRAQGAEVSSTRELPFDHD